MRTLRYMHLRSVLTRGGDALSDAALIAVHLRRVDMAIAEFERQSDDLCGPGCVLG